jgi:hypothetical protein
MVVAKSVACSKQSKPDLAGYLQEESHNICVVCEAIETITRKDEVATFIRIHDPDLAIFTPSQIGSFYKAWLATISALSLAEAQVPDVKSHPACKSAADAETLIAYIGARLPGDSDEIAALLALLQPFLTAYGTVASIFDGHSVQQREIIFTKCQETELGRFWKWLRDDLVPCFSASYKARREAFIKEELKLPRASFAPDILNVFTTPPATSSDAGIALLKLLKDSVVNNRGSSASLSLVALGKVVDTSDHHKVLLLVELSEMTSEASKTLYVFSNNNRGFGAGNPFKSFSNNWATTMDQFQELHNTLKAVTRDHLYTDDVPGKEEVGFLKHAMSLAWTACLARYLDAGRAIVKECVGEIPDGYLDTILSYDFDIIGKRVFTEAHNSLCDKWEAFGDLDLKMAYTMDIIAPRFICTEDPIKAEVMELHHRARSVQGYIIGIQAVSTTFTEIQTTDNYVSRAAIKSSSFLMTHGQR